MSDELEENSQKACRNHVIMGDGKDGAVIAKESKISCRNEFRKRSSTASHSRDSNYTDSTGVDLLQFITSTLHKNQKDRSFLLDVESKMLEFIANENQQVHRFEPMSSYNRMLIHRIAAFFGLDHNVNQDGTAVVINKSDLTRTPELKFESLISHSNFSDHYRYRRNVQSFDEGRLSDYVANFSICGTGLLTENFSDPNQLSNARRWCSERWSSEWHKNATQLSSRLINNEPIVRQTLSNEGSIDQFSPTVSSCVSPSVWPYYYGYQWQNGSAPQVSVSSDDAYGSCQQSLYSPTFTPIYYPAQTPMQQMIVQPPYPIYNITGENSQPIPSQDEVSLISMQLNNQLVIDSSQTLTTPSVGSGMVLRRALSSPTKNSYRDRKMPKNAARNTKRRRQRSHADAETLEKELECAQTNESELPRFSKG